MTETRSAEASDIVWGARAIGELFNLTERQAFYRLERGQISGARKVGKVWTGSKAKLLRPYQQED